ncbi:MAG: hypothetical protein ACXACO_14420 [Promethearchaeota archaeon]|jgi:hypothetical protein
MLVFKVKLKDSTQEVLLDDTNHLQGEIELELFNQQDSENDLKELYSINEDDWLLP